MFIRERRGGPNLKKGGCRAFQGQREKKRKKRHISSRSGRKGIGKSSEGASSVINTKKKKNRRRVFLCPSADAREKKPAFLLSQKEKYRRLTVSPQRGGGRREERGEDQGDGDDITKSANRETRKKIS